MKMTNLSCASHPAVITLWWTSFEAKKIRRTMNPRTFINSMMLLSLLSAGLIGCATEEKKEAKLQAQAKVTRTDAEKIALSKAPGGSIKEGELEKEKGKLIWSFDIAMPGSTDIKEVQVDAITGEVVSVETETAALEAKENKGKAEDKK